MVDDPVWSPAGHHVGLGLSWPPPPSTHHHSKDFWPIDNYYTSIDSHSTETCTFNTEEIQLMQSTNVGKVSKKQQTPAD